jgi:hypothetical protein
VVCELHDGENLVRIAVRDEGCAPGEPHPSPQRPEEEHGRGLLLVDALCHSWGAHEHGPGLLVWAELPRRADASHADPGPSNDLGWGAPPKPGPSSTSGEGEAAQTSSGTDTARTGGYADASDARPDEATDTEAEARAHRGTTSWTGALVGPRRETTASTDPDLSRHHDSPSLAIPSMEPRHETTSLTVPSMKPHHEASSLTVPSMEPHHETTSLTDLDVEPRHGPAAETVTVAEARHHGTGAAWR